MLSIRKGDLPRTVPAKFGLTGSEVSGEDLNVKVYDVRRTADRHQVMAKAHIAFGLVS